MVRFCCLLGYWTLPKPKLWICRAGSDRGDKRNLLAVLGLHPRRNRAPHDKTLNRFHGHLERSSEIRLMLFDGENRTCDGDATGRAVSGDGTLCGALGLNLWLAGDTVNQ